METTTDQVSTNDEIRRLQQKLTALTQRESSAQHTIVNAISTLDQINGEKAGIRKELQALMQGESATSDHYLLTELTSEMANEAITALRDEFYQQRRVGYTVQEGISFSDVERSLRANKDALTSLYLMVQAGSRPAVLCLSGGQFCIGETFTHTLPARASCVYDRRAEEDWSHDNRKWERCTGNAVEQAEEMGISVMPRSVFETHFTAFSDDSLSCYDFLAPSKEERKEMSDGSVHVGVRMNGNMHVWGRPATNPSGLRGWRGALWVPVVGSANC